MRRAVFLDRDGVINEVVNRDGRPASPRHLEEFRIVEGAAESTGRFKELGFIVIVVTNQPDIARGLAQAEVIEQMHDRIRRELPVDDVRICPHDDGDRCHCRKPLPGMLTDAARDLDIDLTRSFLIGDGAKDIEAGKKAGCTTILLDASYNEDVRPDYRAADLKDAVDIVRRLAREI